MFRLFLVHLLKAGVDLADGENSLPKSSLPPRRLRNRRIYERFDMDHKHLSLMNDQDILPIRDLSERGFSTEVSERGFKRLVVGDVYECRIRYLNEVYSSHACVRWKAKGFVGFELLKAPDGMRQFMKRLIDPLEIGTAMQRVDEKHQEASDNKGMIWYHGPKETNFFLWYDDTGQVSSWKLESKNRFIKWNTTDGVRTGHIQSVADLVPAMLSPWAGKKFTLDLEVSSEMKQFATDVFMALQIGPREQLIESIIG